MVRYGRSEPADWVGQDDELGDAHEIAREIALRALDRRAHTRVELAQKLAKRGVPADVAEQVLDRFAELRLIDDAQYAHMWVFGQQRRMRSKRVMRQELRTRGVSDGDIEQALAELDDTADYDAALAFARKRARSMRSLEPHVRYRRLAAALTRRGFGADVVRDVLAELVNDSANDLT